MRIAIASDHAGVEHKRAVLEHLRAAGHAVTDCGAHTTASCDYADFAQAACRLVQDGAADRAVLICGTGIGMSIAANKMRGIRCGLAHDVATARLAAGHNHAHALALGARVVDVATAIAMVDAFLAEPFESRHQRRLDKITALESPCSTTC